MSEFRNRIVGPFLVPVGMLAVLAVFVFALSRVLLAVPKYWSVTLAMLLAAEVLGIAAVLAAVRRVTGFQKSLVGLLGVIVLAGGGVGLASGIRPIEAHHSGVTVVAKDLLFEPTHLEVPADAEFELTFDNQDANIPHNVSISSGAEKVFTGEIFNGVASVVYEVPALSAGDYDFICDVHPNMTGTITAGEGGGGHGGEAPAPEGTESETAGHGTGGTNEGGEHAADTIVADALVFDLDTLEFDAGAEQHLTFRNDDSGVPHNVSIYTDDTASESIFVGEIITGPDEIAYEFTIDEPGDYYFRCDVHPDMDGEVLVS